MMIGKVKGNDRGHKGTGVKIVIFDFAIASGAGRKAKTEITNQKQIR
jgi:hypothetical protein